MTNSKQRKHPKDGAGPTITAASAAAAIIFGTIMSSSLRLSVFGYDHRGNH